MKNKKLFSILSLVFASTLVLGGCNTKPVVSSSVESEESSSSSSEKEKEKYTVNFVVNGNTVQTGEVEEGELAVYKGETPTKDGASAGCKYVFRGWDKNIEEPITGNTTFNAVFGEYIIDGYMVDDFESYSKGSTGVHELEDAGWQALKYTSTGWTPEGAPDTISIGSKSEEGKQSLRFDSWANGVGYMFVKNVSDGTYPKATNAIRFKLMTPKLNKVKLLLLCKAQIGTEIMEPKFSYILQPTSNEYIEYTIPFDDDSWMLWDDPEKTIKTVADWTGIHQDDVTNYLTKIQFYIEGNDGGDGRPQVSFLDSVSFVTLDNASYVEEERIDQYRIYTGLTGTNSRFKLEILDGVNATATIFGLFGDTVIQGKVSMDEGTNNVHFKSNDDGATLEYTGKISDAGKHIDFVSVSGSETPNVGEMNLQAVQTVENFEGFESSGTMYYQSNTNKDNRSGLRGSLYCEYFTGGTAESEWGGSGWSLMGGKGDQVDLMTDGGHSGQNYGSFKHAKSLGMRYMQWGLFDGTSDANSFRGKTFSVWAKTGGTGYIKQITIRLYSQSAPTNATRDSRMKQISINKSGPISNWEHFEVELDPTQVYYGYYVFMEKFENGSSEAPAYLYLDDIEVYDVSPYAM